jgi:hypothetical protein
VQKRADIPSCTVKLRSKPRSDEGFGPGRALSSSHPSRIIIPKRLHTMLKS